MQVTRCLREDHELILRVLECFEVALDRAGESGTATAAEFGPFVEFLDGFTAKCHYCKEEDVLFPALERRGMPRDGGPIGQMLHEHQSSRGLINTMAENLDAADAGDARATQVLQRTGRELLALLRRHIEKADHCLLGPAEHLLDEAGRAAVSAGYREVEAGPEYQNTVRCCRGLAQRLIQTCARD